MNLQKFTGQDNFFNELGIGLIIIVLILIGFYFHSIANKNTTSKKTVIENTKTTEQTPAELKAQAQEVAKSPIIIGTASVKPSENLTIYLKKDSYPVNGTLIGLYSLDTKSNYAVIEISKCVSSKQVVNQIGCLFTMPKKEGKYMFRVTSAIGEVLLQSNEIVVSK